MRLVSAFLNLSEQTADPSLWLNVVVEKVNRVPHCSVSQFRPDFFPSLPQGRSVDAYNVVAQLATPRTRLVIMGSTDLN